MILAAAGNSIYWKQSNSTESLLGIIIVGGAILILVVWQLARYGIGRASFSRLASQGKAGFVRSRFLRAARGAGIEEQDVRFLADYGRALGVGNPDAVFSNKARLDNFFREVYRHIERTAESEMAAEERKGRLFAIRETADERMLRGNPLTSTRQLGRNTPLSFITPGEESYPSLILAIEQGGMAVEPVRDPYGEAIRWRRGTKLTCYFYAKGHQGYQFQARVVGWEQVGAREALVISHSDSITPLPSRRHERRDMKTPCKFFRVAVDISKVRGKQQSRARVEGIAFPGTIVDISAGGMGIQTASPLPAGDFVKVELNAGDGVQAAFGKVVRMNRSRGGGTTGIMHIQFVKISRRALNSILSFVYGYAE